MAMYMITLAFRGPRAHAGARGIEPNRGPNRASPVNNHRKDIRTDAASNARQRSKHSNEGTRPDECKDFFLFWELNLRVDQVGKHQRKECQPRCTAGTHGD